MSKQPSSALAPDSLDMELLALSNQLDQTTSILINHAERLDKIEETLKKLKEAVLIISSEIDSIKGASK